MTDDRIKWNICHVDTEWLKDFGWQLDFIEIEQETWETYAEYLQTNWWQQRRKKALADAEYRCSVCNTNGGTLDVHHRTYDRLGDERSNDLIVLCRDCHDLFHRHGKLARG